MSRSRSRDSWYRSHRRLRKESPWQQRSKDKSYRRHIRHESDRSYSRSRSRTRDRRYARRSRSSSPRQEKVKGRSYERQFARSCQKISYSSRNSRSKSRSNSMDSRESWQYRGSALYDGTAAEKGIHTLSPSSCDGTLFRFDTPLISDRPDLWQGVRAGNTIRDLNTEPEFSKLSNSLQVEEEVMDGREKLYFMELTDDLCSLIDINRPRLEQILTNQGVKSLGHRIEHTVYKVIASLLALIVIAKQHPELNRNLRNLTPDSTVCYAVQGCDLTVSIDGNIATVTFKDTLNIGGIIKWLELKDKELSPLYNVLELGKSRLEFFSRLVNIYKDI